MIELCQWLGDLLRSLQAMMGGAQGEAGALRWHSCCSDQELCVACGAATVRTSCVCALAKGTGSAGYIPGPNGIFLCQPGDPTFQNKQHGTITA